MVNYLTQHPGRQPPLPHLQNTTQIPPLYSFAPTSNTNPVNHPHLYVSQTQKTPAQANIKTEARELSKMHFSKWSRKHIEVTTECNQLFSVYVENIPQRWTPIEVHLLMNRHAEVMDVFLPQKKSKAGKFFGFIQFRNNVDHSYVLECINSMFVDGVHLSASIAKSRIPNKVTNGKPGRSARPPRTILDLGPPPSIGNHSFAEALRTPHPQVAVSSAQNTNKSQTMFVSKAGASDWFGCCALGVLKTPMPFKNLVALFPANE
ncbi:hypothetical protein Tsubulata_031475 [Turnera subulata]|uniref:RRM domain-containing protein n=1 Tax=Turnera subulata TaxID=218843 RepID=A0A9Q0JQL2_9ROSI|nr:hypothetical protein Tsubulata_031475 [Turnera subulata]